MAKIYRDIDEPIELEVLKENAQLGNVPNVTTNNQTPTWSMATTLANIVSGETLTKIMGKISKAINDIISHINNKSNPHGVTKSQVGLGNVENKSSKDILNEIEVGGRNLLLDSKGDKKEGFFASFTNVYDGYGEFTITSKKQYMSVSINNGFVLDPREYAVGKPVIWSYDIMCTQWNFPEGARVGEWWMGQRYTLDTETGAGVWKKITQHSLPKFDGTTYEINTWYHIESIVYIPELQPETVATEASIKLYNPSSEVSASVTIRLKNVKLEYGNKATDWTPAPEDYEHILTLNKNGSKIGSYYPLNDSTINITVPTKTSELTNDSGYKTTDNNTTYTLTKSGSTITLTGSDGSKTSVTDSNTKYTLSSFGVTATAAELNKLDGCTATVTELNYVDGVTSNIQTQLNGKLSTSGTAAKATSDANGQNIADTYIKGLSVSGRTITYTKGDGGTGTITTQDTNTTYGVATSSTLGLVKSGGDITVGTDGLMTVKDDSHNHTILNIDNLQTTLDGKLPKTGGTVSGNLYLQKGFNVYSFNGISETSGYVNFAQIKITNAYQNVPIIFELINRNANQSMIINLRFNNSNGSDPTLGSFNYYGHNRGVYIVKSATSTWDLYAKKSESYDNLCIIDFKTHYSYMNGVSITWKNSLVSSLPSGYTQASLLMNASNANTATKLQTARKIAGTSFDGTEDISISYNNLTDKPTIPSGVQVINNLTSSSTTASLAANQGRVLKGYLDKKIVVSSTQPTGQQTGDTWYQII